MLKKYLTTSINIPKDELNKVLPFFKKNTYKAGAIILKEGQIEKQLHYVLQGSIRTYYVSLSGVIKTRHICFEDAVIASLSSFISQKPSFEYVEAIENTVTLTIDRDSFFHLLAVLPSWKNYYILLLEKAYQFQNQKIESYATLSAPNRYYKLVTEHPEFIKRLPNTVIASYLDIAPETLSRIKRP